MGSWRVRLVVHPLTVASVVLLGLNDHVLKQRWPGFVTGKLSDVAGVWMAGAILISVLGSVRWGAAVTALAFGALKTLPAATALSTAVIGGQILRDRTDLLALVVVWPLGRLARRLGAERTARVNDGWSTIGAVFVVIGSAFATSATSCDTHPEVTEVALGSDGSMLAHYGPEVGLTGWYQIVDGRPVEVPDARPVGEITTGVCVAEGCFRVVPDEGVYLDDELAYSYTEEERRQVAKTSVCFQADTFGSIAASEGDGGSDVWVSMGIAGLLHRDPAGAWHEVAVFEAEPPAALADRLSAPAGAALWVLPLIVAGALGITIPLVFRRSRSRRTVVLATLLAVGGSSLWALAAWMWVARAEFTTGPGGVFAIFMVGLVPLVLVQAPWILVLVRRPSRRTVEIPGPSPFVPN